MKKKFNYEYQCPYCSQTSTRKYNIQVHIERKHPYSKQPNPQINNTNEYPLYNQPLPHHHLIDIKNYSPTWNTPMEQPSPAFYSLPNFPFCYPASFSYDAKIKYEENKRREAERRLFYKSVLKYIQKIVIPSSKLQNTQFNYTSGIPYIPLFTEPMNIPKNMPKAHKIYKCHKCFIQTLESFFDFQEIQPTNKFIHYCYSNQQQHPKDNDSQIKILNPKEMLLSVIDYRLKSENKLLKMIIFPDDLIENAQYLKILIFLMDKIGGTKKDPFRWLFELVENEGFVDLGEISSEHWIKRACDYSSTEEKVTKLEKEELKQFINITEGTFGLIKFRIDKKIIYTFSYLPLDNEKTKQDGEEDQGVISHHFSQFAEQVTAATEENQQTEPVDQPITQIDEQQVAGNTGDANQAIEQYIQQLATDPGMQQVITQK
jgi:hypothetical protein